MAGVIEAAVEELERDAREERPVADASSTIVRGPRFSAVRIVREHIVAERIAPLRDRRLATATHTRRRHAAARRRCVRLARALDRCAGRGAADEPSRGRPPSDPLRRARRAAGRLVSGSDLDPRACVFAHVAGGIADALRRAQNARSRAAWAHDAALELAALGDDLLLRRARRSARLILRLLETRDLRTVCTDTAQNVLT
jgi:hypothetical protein